MTHDFRVGDRCFVFGGQLPVEDGTNATVTGCVDDTVGVLLDGGGRSGVDVGDSVVPRIYHCRPDFVPPPRPKKKKVKKMFFASVYQKALGDVEICNGDTSYHLGPLWTTPPTSVIGESRLSAAFPIATITFEVDE